MTAVYVPCYCSILISKPKKESTKNPCPNRNMVFVSIVQIIIMFFKQLLNTKTQRYVGLAYQDQVPQIIIHSKVVRMLNHNFVLHTFFNSAINIATQYHHILDDALYAKKINLGIPLTKVNISKVRHILRRKFTSRLCFSAVQRKLKKITEFRIPQQSVVILVK